MTEAKTMNETETTELTERQIEALIADAPAPDPCAFIPTDAAGVDWVLGKMADARARASRIRQNAELMARAEERKAEMLEWKYGAALQTWLRAELAGGNKKSVRLYNGTLGYRQKPAGVSIMNEAAAIAWAQEHLPEAIAVRLDKKVLTEALLTSREVVSFAMLNDAEEVFYLK